MEKVMYLLVIILRKAEHLDDVLAGLVELGIQDAVTVDAEPLKKSLAYKVPIFAGLKFDLREEPHSKIIMAVSEDQEAGKQLTVILKEVGIDLKEPGVARILTLKLESTFGEPEILDDI